MGVSQLPTIPSPGKYGPEIHRFHLHIYNIDVYVTDADITNQDSAVLTCMWQVIDIMHAYS